ncbi:uncharacterized protein LOC129589360 [Paramacrobiotus metropolitanus]|uniref:uncharacterized protein LOC129589360 n=1 Tax=Paramacrobiotus metropolitanus TaxID=2943436 RepID=UPI00244585A6|nr:uncharacterized protein LOC129589360 [Paramacrobiotus metropolitanus]
MRPMTPVSHNGNRPSSRASPGPLRNIWPPNVPYKYFADDIPYRRSCGGDENEPMIKVYVQSVADPEYVFVVEDEGQEYDKKMGELMVKIENAAASRYSQMLHFGHLPSVGAAVCAKVESPDIPGGEKIWLRALVLNRFVETEELLLFFIDLGETAITPLAAVRSITPELMQIPKWINPVQITGRTNGNGPFDESAIEKARQLLVGKGHEKPVRLFVEDQLQDCIVGSMFLRLADKNESVLNLYRKNGIKF